MKGVEVIGVLASDEDYKNFKYSTIGHEQDVLRRVAKLTIMKGHKIGKKQKLRERDTLFAKGDDIVGLYAKIQRRVGDKQRKALNLVSIQEIIESPNLNEKLKLIDKDFEIWRTNNGHKYKD